MHLHCRTWYFEHMLLNFVMIIVNNCIYPPRLILPGLSQIGYLQEFDSYITSMAVGQTG